MKKNFCYRIYFDKAVACFMLCLISVFSHFNDLSGQNFKDTSAYDVQLPDMVVTAQYAPTHYKQAIHSIDVIKKESITQRGAVTLEQALLISPAVRIYQDPSLGSSIALRGVSANNVSIMIDGVPIIGRQNGQIDLSQISLNNIERIEIVQGPMSNIYGSNAAGGVINIITKKTQLSTISGNITSQYESIKLHCHQGNLGLKKGKWTLQFNGRYLDYNQYIVDSMRKTDKIVFPDGSVINRQRYPFNPKSQIGYGSFVRYNISDDSHVLLKYDHNNELVTDYGVIKRPQFNPYANDQFFHTTRNDLSLFYKGHWNNHFIDATIASNTYDRISEDKRYYIDSMKFDLKQQLADTVSFNSYISRIHYSYTGLSNTVITAGLASSYENAFGDKIVDHSKADSTVVQQYEWAPYTDIRYTYGQWQLSASSRYTINSAYTNKWTPALQMKYSINKHWTMRAGYAIGYRSPSLKELYLEFIDINHHVTGNVDLNPETSYDMQIGINYTPSASFELSANSYHTTIKDRISLNQLDLLSYTYDNVDHYTVYGFQPSLRFNHSGLGIQSSMSIGYWSSNIDAESVPAFGRVIDLNNNLTYRWNKMQTTFTINHRHVGNQPIYQTVNNILEIGEVLGYDIFDLSVSKSLFKKRINFTFGVKNALNIRSSNIVGQMDGGIHTGEGRNVVSQGRSIFGQFAYNF